MKKYRTNSLDERLSTLNGKFYTIKSDFRSLRDEVQRLRFDLEGLISILLSANNLDYVKQRLNLNDVLLLNNSDSKLEEEIEFF